MSRSVVLLSNIRKSTKEICQLLQFRVRVRVNCNCWYTGMFRINKVSNALARNCLYYLISVVCFSISPASKKCRVNMLEGTLPPGATAHRDYLIWRSSVKKIPLFFRTDCIWNHWDICGLFSCAGYVESRSWKVNKLHIVKNKTIESKICWEIILFYLLLWAPSLTHAGE